MSDQALFKQETQTEAQPQATVSTGELFKVGERSYDADAAQKKILNADTHISTIEAENAQLKQQLQQAQMDATVSQKIDEALSRQGSLTPEATPVEQTAPTAQVNEDELYNKFRQRMNLESQAESQKSNVQKAMELAQNTYGDSWESDLIAKGQELGLDSQGIEALAKMSPQVFGTTFGLQAKSSTPSPQGSVQGYQAPAEEAPKALGVGASTKDLIEQLRYSGRKIAKEHGIDYDPSVHSIPRQTYNR